jgi:hypothetical protein
MVPLTFARPMPELGTLSWVDGFFYWSGKLLFSPQGPKLPGQALSSEDRGLYEASADRKSWTKIATFEVVCLSPAETAWLVRKPETGSYWVYNMSSGTSTSKR